MKYSVGQPLSGTQASQSQNSQRSQIIVDLPATLLTTLPAPDEFFEVRVSRDGTIFETCQACFLADGRSFLVGNEVVRVSRRMLAQKNEVYRLSVGSMPTPHTLQAKVLRPVEPKKGLASLGGGDLKSPMTGKVLVVNVSNGSVVNEGDVLLTIEAMKMENRVLAECAGTIKNLKVAAGQSVNSGDLFLTLEPSVGA